MKAQKAERLFLVKTKHGEYYLSMVRMIRDNPYPRYKSRPVVKTEGSIRRWLKKYRTFDWGSYDVIEVTYAPPRDLVHEFFVDAL